MQDAWARIASHFPSSSSKGGESAAWLQRRCPAFSDDVADMRVMVKTPSERITKGQHGSHRGATRVDITTCLTMAHVAN